MKIAVSSTGPSLDAEVDPRFGRCMYFLIVDPDTMEFEAVENTSAMASGGAGIASAQTVSGKGVEAVLTGQCGPNAYQTLSAAGIQVVTGVSGRIRDVVEEYKAGKYKKSFGPTVAPHFGMGQGMGRGTMAKERDTKTIEHEIGELKTQSQMLRQQLNEVLFRINQLENRTK